MEAIREQLTSFEGQNNVSKIVNPETNAVSYLTQSVSFGDETYALGACKLNTRENTKNNKHVLFLFNASDAEVGRYYMCKSVQGKTPEELVEMKHTLLFFKSWNPTEKNWVPCVSMGSQDNAAKDAVAF